MCVWGEDGQEPPTHHIIRHTHNHTLGVFEKAGVVTNSEICTNIALDILADDGSAVDAAIAALLCEGITNPQSMGIGGGFLMSIYDAATQKVDVLNAREVAPLAAYPEMFSKLPKTTDNKDIAIGGLSVAVPGELMGYWEAHKRYGKISWYDLFRPAIDLAATGQRVTPYTADMIKKIQEDISKSTSMKVLLTNPETKNLYKVGEIMQRPTLADTLEVIAQNGPNALYDGCLTDDFVQDIRDNGGIITREDLRNYKASWEKPVEHFIGNYAIYSAGIPGSGQLLMYVLDVMASKLCNVDASFWHRFVETWKFAFGIRAGYSGGEMSGADKPDSKVDPALVEQILTKIEDTCTSNDPKDYLLDNPEVPIAEDHGTSHICIYAPNGDAVSVTSTINLSFGALFVSETTGIILNNEMIDFSIPNHYDFKNSQSANQIIPKHYPMSTMLPTIVLDLRKGSVRLVIGAAGGFKILSATSLVILQNLYMGTPLKTAIATRRLHHQLNPMVVEFEEGFDEKILMKLQKIGHVMQPLDSLERTNSSSSMATYSCVNGISIVNDLIFPVGDQRRRTYAGGL